MALEMEDITPAKDGGVLKKVIKQGVGQIVPDKAIVRGTYIICIVTMQFCMYIYKYYICVCVCVYVTCVLIYVYIRMFVCVCGVT